MPSVPTSPTDAQLAASAWPVLEDWLSSTADGRAVLGRFTRNPKGEAGTLRHWLRTHEDQAPPQLANYVYGGRVDRLVNIAQAGVVYQQEIHDYTGWWAFSQTRGLPRILIVLGVLFVLAAFACIGYTVVHAASTFNSGLSDAEQACRDRFPVIGFEQTKCLGEANAKYGGADFVATPWIPLGALFGFAGLTLAAIGSLLARPHRG